MLHTKWTFFVCLFVNISLSLKEKKKIFVVIQWPSGEPPKSFRVKDTFRILFYFIYFFLNVYIYISATFALQLHIYLFIHISIAIAYILIQFSVFFFF